MHMRCGDRGLKTGNEFPGLCGTGFRKSGEVERITPDWLWEVNHPGDVNRLVI